MHEMLDLVMQIFIISSQAQAISHCVFTFLDTFLHDKDGSLGLKLQLFMERQGLNLHKKLLQYLNSKSSPHVSDPVCRFIEHLF